MTTIAGTGHRPSPGRFDSTPETFEVLVSLAYNWLLDEQPDVIVCGMALGFDQALAKAAIELRIPVVAFLPFIGQADRWTKRQAETYDHLLSQCAEKKLISRDYHPAAFQRRNEAMVDACDSVLALWDGTPGGTANCVRYAESGLIDVVNLWPEFKKLCSKNP